MNARNFQCFVCFNCLNSFDEFKGHIIEKHEEGRDYIICPVDWCQYPVRDIRMHFKAKHPSLKLPTVKQMKAIVFRDGKEKKVRKPKFRSGFMFSQKNNKEFYYRSNLECETLELLEQIDKVVKYDVEPIEINYFFNGESHKYIPDLSIFYEDKNIEIVEIKPSNQFSLPVNQAKWKAAEHFCQTRGWKFTVINEREINKLKKMINRL